MDIPFSDFRPDASPFNPSAALSTTNAIPVGDGWGPAKSFAAFSSALPAQCYGGIDARNNADSYSFFAFTTASMHKYDTTTLGWDDVTPTAGATNLPNGDLWSATTYGREYVVATNENDGPQVFQLGTSTEFAALSGSPPAAKYVHELGEYLILSHLASDSHGLQWSGIGDITKWTLGQDGSNNQTFPSGGPIQGLVPSERGAYIFQQEVIRQMIFTPQGSYAFMFNIANPARGCVSPGSIVQANSTVFYLDEDGFYMGVEGVAIGAEKVNRYFLSAVDENFINQVQGSSDPANKIVWWRYRKTDGTYEMLGYDWQLGRWCKRDDNVNFLISIHSPGYTLEGLSTVSNSLDALPYSLDSRVWKGGRPAFGGFDSSHQFGYFEGTNLAATLDTAQVALSGKSKRSTVREFRFETDADDHTGKIAKYGKHGDATSFSSSLSPQPSGAIKTKSNGRLHKFRLEVPAGEVWTHAHGVEPVFRRAGKR